MKIYFLQVFKTKNLQIDKYDLNTNPTTQTLNRLTITGNTNDFYVGFQYSPINQIITFLRAKKYTFIDLKTTPMTVLNEMFEYN